MDCGFLVYLYLLLFYLYFYTSTYEFHIQYNFLLGTRRVKYFPSEYKKKKKKKKKVLGLEGPMRSMLKVRESQKNDKNNKVGLIMITSTHVCARVESCDETRTHTYTHNGNTHTYALTPSHTIVPSFCSLWRGSPQLIFFSFASSLHTCHSSSSFIYSFIYSLLL